MTESGILPANHSSSAINIHIFRSVNDRFGWGKGSLEWWHISWATASTQSRRHGHGHGHVHDVDGEAAVASSSPGEKYKVKMAKIQSEIQKISYVVPLRRNCTRWGSRQKGGTPSRHKEPASRQKRNCFPPYHSSFPAKSGLNWPISSSISSRENASTHPICVGLQWFLVFWIDNKILHHTEVVRLLSDQIWWS